MLRIFGQVVLLAFGFIELGFTLRITLRQVTQIPSNTECNEVDSEYAGTCKDGRYHGFGNLSYPDGGHYSGEWRHGLRNGNGTMEFASDNSEGRKSYNGEWRNDVVEGYGRMEWRGKNPYNVVSYEGYYENDLEHGYGKCIWQNGDIYDGNWINGKNTGNGTYFWTNGNSYSGEFYMGKLTGYGNFTFSDGTVYEGKLIDGIFTGNGKMIWKNGDVYKGDFVDGKRTGYGTYNYTDGRLYEGELTNGYLNGTGLMKWADGRSYDGAWVNGSRTGYGKTNFSDGASYSGEYVDGEKSGSGRFDYDDGSFYIGQWKNDKKHGNGTYEWSNGEKYVGEWENDNKHGNGMYEWSNGDKYVGEWKYDGKNGKGTFFYSSGNGYTGHWKSDEKHGNGTFQYKDGASYSGDWDNGELVNVTEFKYTKDHHSSSSDCPTFKKSLDEANVTVPWYIKSGDNTDMGVWSVWDQGITGKGVIVSVVDDGVSRCHPSIKDNFDIQASFDVTDNDEDPSPVSKDDWQGTKGASIIAGKRNEPVCTIGVAYNARIGGIRMLQDPITDLKEAKSLSFRQDYIDIFQISWGPDDDGKTFDGPGKFTRFVLKDGAEMGRNGLGSIFVLASGTGGSKADDCNADGYANSIYTMAISSVDKTNKRPWFSERCSSILATAYSGERRIGTGLAAAGISADSCSLHDGTAASASIGTGIVALMLEANPSLSWRDVQHITVLAAQSERLLPADNWLRNGAGLMVSHSFGFGIMDAEVMVEKARNWVSVGKQQKCQADTILKSDNKITISMDCPMISRLEHVQMSVKIVADDVKRGDISIELVSPSGTKSSMISERRNDRLVLGFDTKEWPLMSTHFWGETPSGSWTINISARQKPEQAFDGEFLVICFGTSEA